MPFIRINNVDLYYEVHGKGDALLLISGLASDSQCWQGVLQRLAKHHTVIVFDNRGVGKSSVASSQSITISQMVDDVFELLEKLGIKRASILGHSMGGFVALEFAKRYPKNVKNLILVATSSKNSIRNKYLFRDWAESYRVGEGSLEIWFRNLFYWIFSKNFFDDKSMLEESLKQAINNPNLQTRESFNAQVEAINSFDVTAYLGEIKTRTLILTGSEDLLFSNTIPLQNSKHIVINEAAHAIFVEYPREFNEAVLDFLLTPNQK